EAARPAVWSSTRLNPLVSTVRGLPGNRSAMRLRLERPGCSNLGATSDRAPANEARPRNEEGTVAELIRIEGLDVDDAGRLLVTLSAVPSNEWQESFIQCWRDTPEWSSGFRRSIFAGFEGRSVILRNVRVDDFVT